LESLKDIGKESSHTKSKKKLPSLQSYQNTSNNNDHGFGYSDEDDGLSLPSPLSPAPPALSPPSDFLTPKQEFDEISPLSHHLENGAMPQYDEPTEMEDDSDVVEDNVMSTSDIKRLDPVHSIPHDEDTCLAWDIPEHFDMVELARRISLLSETQAGSLYLLIQKHQTSTMAVDKKNGKDNMTNALCHSHIFCFSPCLLDNLTMDLYSLGTPLLTRIWDFTESIYATETDNE
jgi:hypothetical protein